MKRIVKLTQNVLSNIAANLGRENRLRPLKSLDFTLNGQPLTVTVTRIGEIDKFTLSGNPQIVLVYIEGYGGIACHIQENELFPNGKLCPMHIVPAGSEMYLDINRTKVYPQLKYDVTRQCYGYGGYTHMKEKFVRVDFDSLDHKNPITLSIPSCRIDIQEIMDLAHPNLIILRKETIANHAATQLLCFDETGSDYTTLSRNWFQKRTQHYPEIAKIIDPEERLYLVKDTFNEWYEEAFEAKGKYA